MDQLVHIIDGNTFTENMFAPTNVLLSFLLAFVLGQVLAWVYYATHKGLSYSRSFVQSLILITVVVSMVMSSIANSLITAVGLMGALAIIRFRNVIKDTRDIAFIFCTLVVGMATSAQRFSVAIVGTIILSLIALYLHWTSFGSHQPHNGFLRFHLDGTKASNSLIPKILKDFCSSFTLISVQDSGSALGADYAYQIMVSNAAKNELLISMLERVDGLKNINLTMQEQLLEV